MRSRCSAIAVASASRISALTRSLDKGAQLQPAVDGHRVLGGDLDGLVEVRALEDVEAHDPLARRQGELLVTDGPFAEAREWIVGFDVLDCADLDEAIKVAAEHPMAVGGRLELRPFVED